MVPAAMTRRLATKATHDRGSVSSGTTRVRTGEPEMPRKIPLESITRISIEYPPEAVTDHAKGKVPSRLLVSERSIGEGFAPSGETSIIVARAEFLSVMPYWLRSEMVPVPRVPATIWMIPTTSHLSGEGSGSYGNTDMLNGEPWIGTNAPTRASCTSTLTWYFPTSFIVKRMTVEPVLYGRASASMGVTSPPELPLPALDATGYVTLLP
mmetsp:Transcript_67369/g.154816  ORF Transcript_67369/g.154816 Transcript_67369/m.154816 type:complete len:210 (-) Transcript_67369:282-911(-)